MRVVWLIFENGAGDDADKRFSVRDGFIKPDCFATVSGIFESQSAAGNRKDLTS